MLTDSQVLEIGKMVMDFFKQMTTLNTGMVVILFALVEKILPRDTLSSPKNDLRTVLNKVIFSFCLFFFLVSFVLSLFGISQMPNNLVHIFTGTNLSWADPNAYSFSIYTFIAGVLLFSALAVINIIRKHVD